MWSRIGVVAFGLLWMAPRSCLLSAAGEDWVSAARNAQARGDYLKAAEAYAKVIEAGGESAELRSNCGLMLYLAGRYTQAFEQSLVAVKLDQRLVGGNLVAGLSLLGLHRAKEAVPYLERASRADTTNAAPAWALAKAYLALQDVQRSNLTFEEATKRDPLNAEAWYGLGVTCRSLAEEAFRRSAKSDAASRKRGEDLLDKAYKALERAGKLDPTSVHASLIIAESLRESGALDTAVAQYEAAIRQHPDDIGGHLGLATTYWRYGRIDDAFAPLSHALELAPGDPDANWMMADILSRRGDHKKAMACAKVALVGNPSLLGARAVLAKAYLEDGHPELVVEQLEKALPLDEDGSYHYLLYQAYSRLGQTEQAARALATFKGLRKASRESR